MRKLLALTGSTVGSTVGWAVGAPVGTMTAFLVSMVGFGLGWWAGLKLAERWGA